jgi:hypothetical protein
MAIELHQSEFSEGEYALYFRGPGLFVSIDLDVVWNKVSSKDLFQRGINELAK